jgi:hypothetical protein
LIESVVPFSNGAYDIWFEKQVDENWVFHSSPAATEGFVSLDPGEITQYTHRLDYSFQPARYRVRTTYLGYAEFSVIPSERGENWPCVIWVKWESPLQGYWRD